MTRFLWLLPLLLLAGESDAQTCSTVAECSAAIDALRRETRLEFDQREIALQEARSVIDGRLEEMNQMRSQINNERGLYASKDKLDSEIEKLKTRLDAADRSWAAIIGGVVVIQALFGIGFALYLKKSPIRAPSRQDDIGRPEVKV